MQLRLLRLGAMALAGAALLAAAPPAPHSNAQSADDAAISSLSEAEQVRIQRAVLNLVRHVRKDRERKVRSLRWKYASGVSREYLESRIAWIEGIESGDPRIMYEMALRLRDGDNLPQHSEAALTWFERAGDHGVPDGLYAAARMLLDDPDLPGRQSLGKVLLWQAARKGVVAAQRDLGMREIAAGPRNGAYDRGYRWLLLAQANGAEVDAAALAEAEAALSSESIQYVRSSVKKAAGKDVLSLIWPIDEEIGAREAWGEELRIALRWEKCGRALAVLDDARQTGDPEADHELAVLYEEGNCVEQDATKALDHYNGAVDGGHLRSAFRLGLLYYDGRGTARDPALAQHWFKAAALTLVGAPGNRGERTEHASNDMPPGPYLPRELPPELVTEIGWLAEIEDGDPKILHETALRVRDGDGLPRVRYAAEVWLSRAGKRGIAEAYYDLGRTLLDAPLYPIHPERGVMNLARAGRDGFVPAQVELGRRYAAGNQVQRWDHAAYVWLLIAKDNGAEISALLEDVGRRLSDQDRATARAEAEKGIYYPLDSR